MVVHLFLNNNKALDFLPINSIKNGGVTQGSQESNYLVGTRYEDGCGTEKDIQKAIFWYRRAPSYGPALSRLNELTKPQS